MLYLEETKNILISQIKKYEYKSVNKACHDKRHLSCKTKLKVSCYHVKVSCYQIIMLNFIMLKVRTLEDQLDECYLGDSKTKGIADIASSTNLY